MTDQAHKPSYEDLERQIQFGKTHMANLEKEVARLQGQRPTVEQAKRDMEYWNDMCQHLRTLLKESRWELEKLTSLVIQYMKRSELRDSAEWLSIHDKLVFLTGVVLDPE